MPVANGIFHVSMIPQSPAAGEPDVPGRMMLNKQFEGDLEAVGHGQMLTAMTDVPNSAAYVAIEQVNGVLAGRKGTFVLQHTGIMQRGQGSLQVVIVPDSGTGQLAGIAGSMTIDPSVDPHTYALDYALPETP